MIGIVKSDDQLFSYEEWYNFVRGGAEVYIVAARDYRIKRKESNLNTFNV